MRALLFELAMCNMLHVLSASTLSIGRILPKDHLSLNQPTYKWKARFSNLITVRRVLNRIRLKHTQATSLQSEIMPFGDPGYCGSRGGHSTNETFAYVLSQRITVVQLTSVVEKFKL